MLLSREQDDSVLQNIEDDYKTCLRIIGRYFEYLETCGLSEFNKYSKYKWSYDRDKKKGYSYVCIRYGNSMEKKCLIKRRAYIESEDLYKWVENRDLVREALDEAYKYIEKKISTVKSKIEAIRLVVEDYEEKLEEILVDHNKVKIASKKLGGLTG